MGRANSVPECLTPERALIFRITHLDNLRWILRNGLHSSSSETLDPDFRTIGLPGLIERRSHWRVPVDPGGALGDYVPFYFTPFSPMAYKVHTGHGVPMVPNDRIVILTSSLHRLAEQDVPFLFSDRHAADHTALFFRDLRELERLSWEQLRTRDFSGDEDDPLKVSRYEAEALVHRHLPIDALLGIAC